MPAMASNPGQLSRYPAAREVILLGLSRLVVGEEGKFIGNEIRYAQYA
jgi:hypothetical protein